MAKKDGKRSWVTVNRAPVLTFYAAVVAEVLGVDHDEALTFGRGVRDLNAYYMGVSLGLFQPAPMQGKTDNPYAFFSLSLPRISLSILPCCK